jgi:hypothetical protein
MATQRPKTNVEAQQRIMAQMDEIRPLLRQAMASGDKAAIEKYSDEMTRLDRMMRATAEIIGQIGSGLQSGISGLFTAIPDIATAGVNLFRPTEQKITSLGDVASQQLGIQNQPASDESAYAFRIAQGAGSASIPGQGTRGLLLGTGLGAGDVAVSQSTGLPEGLVSGAYAVANLTRAGFKGIKDFRESRKFEKFLKDNVPVEGQNVFRQFMLRGQGSDSPIVSAAIQRLRTNPEYAELFAKFDKAASDLATKGMTPTTRVGGKQEATEAVATRVQREIDGLRQQRSEAGSRVFEQAKGYGSDRGIIDPNKTISEIDTLIADYSKKITPNSERAVAFLTDLKSRMLNETGSARKLTVDETQSILSEFGRKATQGDSLVKDLAISDETRISAKIFGGLKDDLQLARRNAKTPEDKAAAGLLIQAREQVRKASDSYNESIAQGIPSFLKDKSLSEISYEDLYSNYKGLNEYQRAKVRSYVGTTDQEALNFLDKNIFQDFVKSAQGKNDSGVFTTDLEKLATNWKTLGDNEKAALVTALGTNAKEFDQRMNDALSFTRRMKVAQPSQDQALVDSKLQRGISAVAGTGLGYQASKGVDVTLTAMNELLRKQGFTDEQLMRVLLTPEGANFLRQGALTGASAKTLEALTNVPTALQEGSTGFSALTRLVSPSEPMAPTAATQSPSADVFVPEDIFVPEEPMPTSTAPVTQPTAEGVFVPEDIFSSEVSASPKVNVNGNIPMRQGIFNQELNTLLQRSNAAQAAGDQAAMQGITGDIQALLREAQRNKLQLSVQ